MSKNAWMLPILIRRAVKLDEETRSAQKYHVMRYLRHNDSQVVSRHLGVCAQRGYAIPELSFQNHYFCPYTGFRGVILPQCGGNGFLRKYRCPLVWDKAIGHLELIAPNTVEHFSYHSVTAFLGNNPPAIDKRRIMPYMLRMAATEECYRVAFAVHVKSCNWSFHK